MWRNWISRRNILGGIWLFEQKLHSSFKKYVASTATAPKPKGEAKSAAKRTKAAGAAIGDVAPTQPTYDAFLVLMPPELGSPWTLSSDTRNGRWLAKHRIMGSIIRSWSQHGELNSGLMVCKWGWMQHERFAQGSKCPHRCLANVDPGKL